MIRILRLLILIFLLVNCISTRAQTNVHGIVTDAESGETLMGVVVFTSIGVSTLSDPNGAYYLVVSDGVIVLNFEFLGYEKKSIDLILSAGEARELNVQLNSSVRELGVVVVSAGKYEQNIGEVTVSMEVIKPKLIQDKNAVALDDILQQTPGVSIVDNEPQIRSGSGYSFGAGSRVQVLVDDLPMISGDAGKPSWDFLPIENLSQVEIIKGASSVLYGSSALSGVINLRTAYPTDEPQTRLVVYHGFYSNPRSDSAKYWSGTPMRTGFNFFHSEKIGRLDLVVGTNVLADDGYLGPIESDPGKSTDNGKYRPLTVDRYNAQARARVNLNLGIHSKKILGLTYGLNSNFSQSESLATLIWKNSSEGLYSAYNGSATRTKQFLHTMDPYIVFYNQSGSRHSLRTRWQSLDNNNDNNQGNFSDVLYGEYQFQHHWDTTKVKKLTTTFGLVGISTKARGELFTGGNADGKNTAKNAAAYFQIDREFLGRLNVSGGLRYEYFEINKASQSKPVFRAGANYKLGRASYLRASFGQGYRFPSIAEKFIITSLGAIKIFANPDLKPETSYNAEMGVKQGFKIGRFLGYADIAFFQQEFKNFIEFTFGQWDPEPGISNQFGLGFKSLNTGRARVQGVEFSLMGEGKIGAVKVQTLAGYTYTKPVSLTPDFVYASTPASPNNPYVLDQFARSSYQSTSSDPSNTILKYRLQHLVRADVGAQWRAFFAGISFRSNSHMQNIDGAFQQLETALPAIFNPGINKWRKDHTKGDYVFDVRFGYNISDHHRIGCSITNLLNREYAIRPLAVEETRLVTFQYMLTL